jgi:hypothetical protein
LLTFLHGLCLIIITSSILKLTRIASSNFIWKIVEVSGCSIKASWT